MTAQKQMLISAAQYHRLGKSKRSKYGAKPKTVDGIRFHSTGEGMRWLLLRQKERDGEISLLARQIHVPLHTMAATGDQKYIGKYIADFRYLDSNGALTVEDYKGYDNPLSAWKRKHAELEYSLKILITGPAAKRSKR